MSLPGTDGELVLLHNPRCSKSRAALSLLEERGARYVLRPYLEAPLALDELRELVRRLGRPASEWVRRGESAYEEAGLGPEASEEALLAAIAERPILMERPILVGRDRAVVGRPPENILELL